MGAGNQQERLSHGEGNKHFLAGFIEGEGALCVSVKQHPTARFGYLVDPEFFLYQHTSGRPLLELAAEIFETGRIFSKPGNPRVLVFAIVSQRSLRDKVVPFFEQYVAPISCKRTTFERFREILEMMERKDHLNAGGLIEIIEKAYAMNPESKGRHRAPNTRGSARENPQRPYAEHPVLGMKIWSSPHGDMRATA